MSFGHFMSGLFGGYNTVDDIITKFEEYKARHKAIDDLRAARDEQKKLDQNNTGLPKVYEDKSGGPGNDWPEYNPKDIDVIQVPAYTNAMPDAAGLEPVKKSPPTYLPDAAGLEPVTKQPDQVAGAAAGLEPVAQPGGPGGEIGFSLKSGFHRTKPGEQGLSNMVGGALGNAFGGIRFSPSQGLYREGSAITQQPASPTVVVSTPQPQPQPQPQQALPVYLPRQVDPGTGYIEPPPALRPQTNLEDRVRSALYSRGASYG